MRNLVSYAFAKEEELPDEHDLETMLEAEQVKLDLRIIEYIKAVKNVQRLYLNQRQVYQKSIIGWKRDLVKSQINKSKLCLDYFQQNEKTEVNLDEISKIPVNVVVMDLCDRKDGCITYHEPHCPNYFLFEEHSSPYI